MSGRAGGRWRIVTDLHGMRGVRGSNPLSSATIRSTRENLLLGREAFECRRLVAPILVVVHRFLS
jgi:hypothetical protein